VGTIVRNTPKNPPSDAELRIMGLLGMQGLMSQGLNKRVLAMVSNHEFWHPPPLGFLKYNIDGASKGNLGYAGFGGVLRNDTSNILSIFHGHLGRATNNMAEAMAMEQCLDLLVQEN